MTFAVKKIVYISGTRADFGLMRRCLQAISASPDFDVSIIVTGMHLDAAFGDTVQDIVESGVAICAKIPTDMSRRDGASMANAIGEMTIGFTRALDASKPDLVLLLGDRGEMLAAAIACLHLGIPTAHLHGGERSGTVDEPVRHAISKLASFHLCATESSAVRLCAMGEAQSRVFVVGAPGLAGLDAAAAEGEDPLFVRLCQRFGPQARHKFALVIFHPLAEATDIQAQTHMILTAVGSLGMPVVWLKPNADAGSGEVLRVLDSCKAGWLLTLAHLPRNEFCAAMKHAKLMLGNSSSGIIEAASFATPVVNVGGRQHLRERSANVIDVPFEQVAIHDALQHSLNRRREPMQNVYGSGDAVQKVLDVLGSLQLGPSATEKSNVY